ncbi:ACB domain-containing protein [Forsythia ovata]|uniref:ACB domain-containing protein n=1 Tax=Forsythia ovata TaxID=205694 RepID=A0ABD1W3Y1_9LAMI
MREFFLFYRHRQLVLMLETWGEHFPMVLRGDGVKKKDYDGKYDNFDEEDEFFVGKNIFCLVTGIMMAKKFSAMKRIMMGFSIMRIKMTKKILFGRRGSAEPERLHRLSVPGLALNSTIDENEPCLAESLPIQSLREDKIQTHQIEMDELRAAKKFDLMRSLIENVKIIDDELEEDKMGLKEEFEECAEQAKTLLENTSNENKLILYGLYKQATVGNVNTRRPGMFNIRDRAMWYAWKAVEGKSQEEAMNDFITKVKQLKGAA